MKTVYLVRHAKSSWEDPRLSDHDRPLNDRGRRDAPRMASLLVGHGIAVDGILTSTAKRARRTARTFREAYGLDRSATVSTEDLYHAGPTAIERCVRALPETWNTVLVFGHNPGFTEAANAMRHADYIDNVPTCGIVGGRCDVDNWEDWSLRQTRRLVFFYPKQLR